ncbi:MAG: acyl-CoA desaturase [Bdellovibrionales bacterium]|nr:acyl-CoA desaturase [Bdellovibrionales bacterium]
MSKSFVRQTDWFKSIPFLALHAAAVVGGFLVDWTWGGIALCAGLYYLRMFAITAGYHRYFSHRTYKTGRVFQFLMAGLGSSAVQKGVIHWVAHHRHHHQFSDQPEDIHSPVQSGFWYSHIGWIMGRSTEAKRWHLTPAIFLALLLLAAGGWSAFYFGFVLSTVVLWHGTFTINSLSHVFGRKRYRTTDESRNNFWLALLTMGEGWHNNHHTYQSSANQGFCWWELEARRVDRIPLGAESAPETVRAG